MVRTREIHPRVPPRGPVEGPLAPERQLPPYVPDKDLSFYRDGVRWAFSAGKVSVQGYDVNQLINEGEGAGDVGTWLGIAEGLTEYRKRISSVARKVDQFGRFEAVIEALLGKILGKMKRVYDQKVTGLNWKVDQGQLILNGINVRSFLALYRIRRTDKAKRFLKGLKGKLGLLLENRHASGDYERIREMVEDLYREISAELGDEPPARPARRLLPDRTLGS